MLFWTESVYYDFCRNFPNRNFYISQSQNLTRFFGLWPSFSPAGAPGSNHSIKQICLAICGLKYWEGFIDTQAYCKKLEFGPNLAWGRALRRRNCCRIFTSYFLLCLGIMSNYGPMRKLIAQLCPNRGTSTSEPPKLQKWQFWNI